MREMHFPVPIRAPEYHLESGDKIIVASGAEIALESGAVFSTEDGIGAGNGSTVTVAEYGNILHKTVLTCAATPVTIADEAAAGQYGGVKIYDFPAGLILTLGAVIDGSLLAGVTGTIIATWDGDVALGTAAPTSHSLATTASDVLQSTATTQAVAKVGRCDALSAATALTESGARWFDGSGTAKDLYINWLIDDDETHTAGTGAFTGTVTIHWLNLGDV